jgi:hypothetical protein
MPEFYGFELQDMIFINAAVKDDWSIDAFSDITSTVNQLILRIFLLASHFLS